MYKVILTLILTTVFFYSFSQFTWLNPVPTGNNLRKIVFIDKENAFAIGDAGIILNTKDNGNNWLANNYINHENFIDCNFPTKDTGYILDYNYIFKTTDHGETWEKYKITDDYSCKRLFFIDSQTGFVICRNGKILKTENGGLSWLLIQSSSNTNLEHIKFINKNIGFIIGNPGTILKTIDGGQNWIALNCDYTGQLIDIQTFNQDTINILGNKLVENGYQSVLLETKDGGLTWQEKFKDNLNAFFTMYFINNKIGFLANDKIYKTIDGGITWLKVFEKTNFLNIISISFSNNKNGIAVGEHGVILITEDQGLTWKSIDKGIYNHIFDIHFPNDNIGFGCGDYGTILKTIDSGKNWNVLTSGNTLYFSIFALNEKDVFVVGAGGAINKTADGGLSWSPMTIPNNAFFKIFFLENDIGYLLGMHGSYFITYDKGNTWNEGNIGTDTNLKDIFFLNNNIGYLGCENGMLFKTINGGKKWNLLKSNLGKISKIFFKNEKIGFIASNHLYKSIDGGNTWKNLTLNKTSPIANGILGFNYFCDSVMLCLFNSGIIKTLDGGDTWNIINTPVGYIKSIYFNKKNIGYLVGTWGTILQYTLIDQCEPNNLNPNTSNVFYCFPNPFVDKFYIKSNDSTSYDNYEIEIINLIGESVLKSHRNVVDEEPINCMNLKNGLYFILIRYNEKTEAIKMIKL